MNNISENRYFLLIQKKKIFFQALNIKNEIIFKKETFIDQYLSNNTLSQIENFLEKNIFEFEKNLKVFIKEINVIFESDYFFKVGSSISHSIKNEKFEYTDMNNQLIDIKNNFSKHSPSDRIIHMVIDKYIIDGTEYKFLPKNLDFKTMIIQINFICIKKQIIIDLKRIFSKYEISIKKIFHYDYLNNIKNSGKDIFEIATDSIYGLNMNEVIILRKTSRKQGFFEKLFNFFN